MALNKIILLAVMVIIASISFQVKSYYLASAKALTGEQFVQVTTASDSPIKNVPNPQLKIVKHELYTKGNYYKVKGSIYNPYDQACKNVKIKYFIWKELIGGDKVKYGLITTSGGLISAQIEYLPPKNTVEFETSIGKAPIYINMSPNPISAEIEAEWD